MIRADFGHDQGAAVELTPIIDMVFLLLIFFLVATTFHQTEREMQIALPHAAHGGPISAAMRDIVINVDREGTIILNGAVISPEDLQQRIIQAVQQNPEQKVTVRGDRDAPYQHVARVLDLCKGAGVQQPYLDTVPVTD